MEESLNLFPFFFLSKLILQLLFRSLISELAFFFFFCASPGIGPQRKEEKSVQRTPMALTLRIERVVEALFSANMSKHSQTHASTEPYAYTDSLDRAAVPTYFELCTTLCQSLLVEKQDVKGELARLLEEWKEILSHLKKSFSVEELTPLAFLTRVMVTAALTSKMLEDIQSDSELVEAEAALKQGWQPFVVQLVQLSVRMEREGGSSTSHSFDSLSQIGAGSAIRDHTLLFDNAAPLSFQEGGTLAPDLLFRSVVHGVGVVLLTCERVYYALAQRGAQYTTAALSSLEETPKSWVHAALLGLRNRSDQASLHSIPPLTPSWGLLLLSEMVRLITQAVPPTVSSVSLGVIPELTTTTAALDGKQPKKAPRRGAARLAAPAAASSPAEPPASDPSSMVENPCHRLRLAYAALVVDVVRGVLQLLAVKSEGLAAEDVPKPAAIECCRQLVLPLLLSFSIDGAESGVELLHPFLLAMAEEGGEESLESVVVHMSALFDFLFLPSSAPREYSSPAPHAVGAFDYRTHPFLWDTIYTALHYALRGGECAWTAGDGSTDVTRRSTSPSGLMESGRQQNMQLRVTHLLKRIIHFTSVSTPTVPRVFHSLFAWDPERSENAWSDFFLLLETANEFNLHMILPVLPRLDRLVQAFLVPPSSEATPPISLALAPQWVELLLLKFLKHPNLAVRKVVLRRIWWDWTPEAGAGFTTSLSLPFLFGDVFLAASNPRMSSDIDRLPMSATFLEMRAFEWEEPPASPTSEPIAASLEVFMVKLFVHRTRTGEERGEALVLLLKAVQREPSRLAMSTFARTLAAVGVALYEDAQQHSASAAASSSLISNPSATADFLALFRDCLEENVPFWLEVRLSALFFTGLLHLSAIDPERARANECWWRLLCHCGALASSGGRAVFKLEGGSQVVGLHGAGSGLAPRFLLQYAQECSWRFGRKEGEGASCRRFLHRLLSPSTLLTRIHAWMKAESVGSRTVSQLSLALKEQMFLVGALGLPCGCGQAAPNASNGCILASQMDSELLYALAETITKFVEESFNHPYAPPKQCLVGVLAFVVLQQATGDDAWVGGGLKRVASHAVAVNALLSLLEKQACRVIETVLDLWASLTVEEGSLSSRTTHSLQQTSADICFWLYPEHWDVLMAGVSSARSFVTFHCSEGNRPASAASMMTAAWATQTLPNLFNLLARVTSLTASKDLTVSTAHTLLLHHLVQLMQAEVSGLIHAGGESPSLPVLPAVSNDGLPFYAEEACLEEHRVVEQLRALVGGEVIAAYLRQLLNSLVCVRRCQQWVHQAKHQKKRERSSEEDARENQQDAPSSLADKSGSIREVLFTELPMIVCWPDVLLALDRGIYEVAYTLCPALLPGEEVAQSSAVALPPSTTAVVIALETFVLEQLEQCWLLNLPCLFAIAGWLCGLPLPNADEEREDDDDCVTSPLCENDVPSLHRKRLLEGLILHQFDVGAKQQTFLVSMVFAALRMSTPHIPHFTLGYMKKCCMETDASGKTKKKAKNSVEPQSDREVYYASAALSMIVLEQYSKKALQEVGSEEGGMQKMYQSEAEAWELWEAELLPLLVHYAIFFSPPRDTENESTQATTESMLARHWPEALRLRYPAGVHLGLLGRALSVSTLLWFCRTHAKLGSHAPSEVLLTKLLDLSVHHSLLINEPCMPNSETHRARLRLWQLICALQPVFLECTGAGGGGSRTAEASLTEETAQDRVWEKVCADCIALPNLGSIRRYIEIFSIQLLNAPTSSLPQLSRLWKLLDECLGKASLRPQVVGTLVLVAGHVVLHHEEVALKAITDREEENSVAEKIKRAEMAFHLLFPRLVQQSSSHQHLLRIISHVAIHRIGLVRQARYTQHSSSSTHTPAFPHGIAELFQYISDAEEHVKFRLKHEEVLFYDVKRMSSPRSIFCLQRKEANMILCDSIPAAMFERMQYMETEVASLVGGRFAFDRLRLRRLFGRAGSTKLLQSAFQSFPFIPHTSQRSNCCADFTTEAIEALWSDPLGIKTKEALHSADNEAAPNDLDRNLQRKTLSWWTSEVQNEVCPRALAQPRGALEGGEDTHRHSVIVVGSLIENPVNVAGLCRCADIFAVEKLIVRDPSVFEHPHFIAVAKSAERWVPWEAVPPTGLHEYLTAMRGRGYTIVGVEQTTQSIRMCDYAFPKKCILVLGSEGKGMPSALIPFLDVCVEIPQYGLVRSLNVHVTGALSIYEYTAQQVMRREE